MDINLLDYHIKRNGDTRKSISEYLGIHPLTFYNKCRGESQQFTQSEIRAIATRYNLNADDVMEIFFVDDHLNKIEKEVNSN